MAVGMLLDHVARTLQAVHRAVTRTDAKLSRLDFGTLQVALLVAALDGEVLESEFAAFRRMMASCRGYNPENARAAEEAALRCAGYLTLLTKVARRTAEERLAAFLSEAEAAMPDGFVSGELADIRRAFVTWVAMGLSDGTFSDVERRAIIALRERFTESRHISVQCDAAALAAVYPGSAQTNLMAGALPDLKAVPVLAEDFLMRAERIIGDLEDPERHDAAKREMAELIERG